MQLLDDTDVDEAWQNFRNKQHYDASQIKHSLGDKFVTQVK